MLVNRIDKLRKKKGLSYYTIAKNSGVTPMYVSQLARGLRSNPSLSVMRNIANALGETVETVFETNQP